ncbi:hypothetical protein BC941DRAFT_445438 [Chlamydoabsidia padenii]|nr:hypothetical protein BC941DRAFT_445438 [Chlamydoabsidia padenii]
MELNQSEEFGEEIPFGYEQLPQDDTDHDDGDNWANQDDGDGDVDVEVVHTNSVAQTRSSPLILTLNPEESISKETSTLIKDIMKTIQIPSHAVPDWAKTIPESSWIPEFNEN